MLLPAVYAGDTAIGVHPEEAIVEERLEVLLQRQDVLGSSLHLIHLLLHLRHPGKLPLHLELLLSLCPFLLLDLLFSPSTATRALHEGRRGALGNYREKER